MAYIATLNDEIFFNTNSISPRLALISASLTLKAGSAGLFKFKVPQNNAGYDHFNLISSYIDVYRDDEIIFSGRVSSVEMGFNCTMDIEAEGLLSVLNDSVFRPITYNGSLLGLVKLMIDSHNSQVEVAKRLSLGNIQTSDLSCEESYSSYEKTFSRIQDLVDTFGGYPSVKRTSSGLVFDWIRTIETYANQTIDFGENLISVDKSSSSDDIITVLIPLGEQQEDENTGERTRVTIESVNGGKDYIEVEGATEKIVGIYIRDDISDPAILKSVGIAYLEKQRLFHTTLNVTAIDLADAGYNYDNFKIATKINVTSRPHYIENQEFECLEQSLNLLSPADNILKLGVVIEGFSIRAQKEAKQNAIIIENINANYATNKRLNEIKKSIGATLEEYSTEINQTSTQIELVAKKVEKTEQTAITGTQIHYLVSSEKSGITIKTTGWSTKPQTMTPEKKYLWTYVTYTYGDNHTADGDPVISGVYGEKGESGVGISNVTEYYALNNSTTAPADSAFSTGIKTPTATNRYLWNYELITYTDRNTKKLDKHIVLMYSEDGNDGKGVSSITEYYALSTNTTVPADSEFSATVKTPTATNRYLWNYEVITYTDSSSTSTSKHIIGVYGEKGESGVGISNVTEYYALNNSTTAPADSAFSTGIKTPTATNRYLWNYELITYTDRNTKKLDKHIVLMYSEDGNDGKGVSSITEYYALSTNTTVPADSEFSAIVKTPTATNRYLWNYEVITYTDSSSTSTSKHIIGVYGEKGSQGDTGISVTKVVPLYYANNSLTTPSAPTKEVTSKSTSTSIWTQSIPSLTSTYKYLYTCNQVYYSNDTITWSDVVYDEVATDVINLDGRMTTAESSIKQNADNIQLKVSTQDFNGEKITSLINQSASTVRIDAQHIDAVGNLNLNGFIKANSDGTLVLNPSKLEMETSSSSVDYIQLNYTHSKQYNYYTRISPEGIKIKLYDPVGFSQYEGLSLTWNSIQVSGDDYVYYKSYALQNYDASSSVNLANATNTSLHSFYCPAGAWLISVAIRFAGNSSGYRSAWFANTYGGGSSGIKYQDFRAAVNGSYTMLYLTKAVKSDSASYVYIVGYQNSGSSLAADIRVQIFGHQKT